MGGCRCYFRNCHATTVKFRRLHFFRFPLKEPERYKKWRQYAKMEHMLEFTEVRRKNTSICARHFRIECFMNYKMDRLAPYAVPTLMRLSEDQAIDYELDIDNGVLVTLERTKFKHLIPPDNFESSLCLENDQILLEKLSELKSEQYYKGTEQPESPTERTLTTDFTEMVEYEVSEYTQDCEEVITENHVKNLENSVEILETIQVSAPNTKRSREITEDESLEVDACSSNKKCRILNTTNCAMGSDMKNRTKVVLASGTLQKISCGEVVDSDEIDFVETNEIENMDELANDERHLVLTAADNNDDANVQFFEIHKDNNLQYELQSGGADSTRMQLKTIENQFSELKKNSHDLSILQVKLSLLENENAELKETRKENEETKTKLLSLQMENNSIRRALNENKTLNEKLKEYSEENKKLKDEAANIDILKAELISRQQEIKELKNLLERLKNVQSKEQDLIKQFEIDLEKQRSNFSDYEIKMKNEICTLKKTLESTKRKLVLTEHNLTELKTEFKSIKNEKDILEHRHEELEQSFNNMQNNFDSKQIEYMAIKSDYDNLQQKHSVLEQKYWKLHALHNQETTVSTSLEKHKKELTPAVVPTPSTSLNSLTKGQLFNSIKRYLSASMVSLLRMEMFGSSERAWKNDERQVAVDILRLGEGVYKYFTEEWRFRLPALRDVRNWLSQTQQLIDDEEDL